MDNATIQKFLDEHDYDIRKTHNGRWIDQKCTMDVVCLVSDCIVEYTSNREDKRFNCIKYARLFKRGYGSIEQIYRWSTTSPIEMSDERKKDSFICQIKKVAKELGLRG